MTPQQELELFAQLKANNPRLRDWLDQERATAVSVLAVNHNLPTIHQKQGEVQLIDRMLKLLK